MTPLAEDTDIPLSASGVREDLAGAARMAPTTAERNCRDGDGQDCRWYHASWPVLRALGVFNSPGSDDDFLLRAIARELAAGARRVLVSGAADAGMLARVTHCLAPASGVEVTVLDQCRTPLELSRRHAQMVGIEIETVHANILEFESERPFDLICTHSFLAFFPSPERHQLVARWHSLLRPGGCVVTAQRVRPGESADIVRYAAPERAKLVAEAERLARTTGAPIGMEPEAARDLADGYASRYWAHVIRTADELRRPFDDRGFLLEEFAPAPDESLLGDRPGTPSHDGARRWRILARRS